VLFLEDDPAVAEMYKLKLELDGYLVTVVSPGDDVIEVASTLQPELVYLDTQRHAEAALATLRALRSAASTSKVPVIILSDRKRSEVMASGFAPNSLDYLVQADRTLGSLSRDVDQWATARTPLPA
jgi:two-component system phosphate regulon response regulator PhoB